MFLQFGEDGLEAERGAVVVTRVRIGPTARAALACDARALGALFRREFHNGTAVRRAAEAAAAG